ncbi:Serine/threonine-protein phosphatase 2B catalytic subunit [Smittium culicis]|uniref:Serine/threonine-protein phosphatase 2B catalytic subunit n=1 Tax=Smittium culicis TaxID=133412 RepID=A0A1R1YCF7_9FUNG|nr:Serine/threonine-protein phosphatase 2B catalytic subunit [Smittium culicis]
MCSRDFKIVIGDTDSEDEFGIESDNHFPRQYLPYCSGSGLVPTMTGRVAKDVIQPINRIPRNNEVFIGEDHNNINLEFIKLHFKYEGRLSEYQAAKIIQTATKLFSELPNTLSVRAPTSSKFYLL